MSRIVLPLLAACAVLLSTSQMTAGQVPAQGQGTTFRAVANYVTTDVIVHDKDGKFIPNLSVDDFKVYEDGVLQKITNFVPVVGGRALGGLTSINAEAPPSEGLILPKSKPPADQSGRVFIIFIDDMHLQPLDTPQVKALLMKIRDTLVHDTDLVGLVSTGYSSISIDISYDYGHRRFNEAIGKVMGAGLTPQDILSSGEGAEGPTGVRYQAHVAFSTAYDLLEQAAKITNRRKAFIYVSEGYSFNPYKDSRYKKEQEKYGVASNADGSSTGSATGDSNGTNPSYGSNSSDSADPFKRPGSEFAEADLIGELAELTRTARRANVTFYTVDPRGLIGGRDIKDDAISYEDWRDYMNTTISSLEVLGEETGGFCICKTNDFDKGLRRIDAETSDYYILGYSSSNPDPFKLRRTIKIESNRSGLDLIYRSDYTLKKPSRNPKK
jgi:VWFA-related protein